jgi:hypothetical protein
MKKSPPKKKRLLGVANPNLPRTSRRAKEAWAMAYEARDEELRISKRVPTSGTMHGAGDRVLAGSRRKVFEVKTTYWFRGAKPTHIFTMSDGR